MSAPAETAAVYSYEQSAMQAEQAQYAGHVLLERLQAETDITTQLAEIVDGQMHTDFELVFDGQDLYDPYGRSMGEITEKSLKRAREMAKSNPNLWFEVRRASLEREEYLLMLDMAKGNGPNTVIVSSDFPEELRDAPEDVGGYNVKRQQAMERALTLQPNGNIRLQTQSLDGSNRQALEAVHREFGHELEAGEALGQRVELTLATEEQEHVMDRARLAYDRSMSEQFGDEWYAGRRPADYRNTYDFVCRQKDLIDVCVSAQMEGELTIDLLYDIAATMQARFEKNQQPDAADISYHNVPTENRDNIIYIRASQIDMLWQEIRRSGNQARAEGKTFSACGDTLTAQEIYGQDAIESAGYGQNTGESKSWHGGKVYYNEKCQSCKEVKGQVGACKICEDCVENPKDPKLGTTQGKTKDPKAGQFYKKPAKVISLDERRRDKQKSQSKNIYN